MSVIVRARAWCPTCREYGRWFEVAEHRVTEAVAECFDRHQLRRHPNET